MKSSEKEIVFALGALFHAARIAGESAARHDFDLSDIACEPSLQEARDFYNTAQRLDLAPDLPDDDPPPPAEAKQP